MKVLMKILLLAAFLALATTGSVAADECVGSVGSGACYGLVLPDLTNRYEHPADTFLDRDHGIHTSPGPDFGFDGTQLYNRYIPVWRGGELRYADPKEIEELEER